MSVPQKRKRGDRAEGRRLHSIHPLDMLMPFFLKERGANTNYVRASFEITQAEKYVRQKRVEGLKGFGMLHFIVASYVRVISQNPALNRFTSGHRMFTRHMIEISMVVKKELTVAGEPTTLKVVFDPRDTAVEVYHKIDAAIAAARAEDSDATNDMIRKLAGLPRPLLQFTVWLLETLDYHGRMPKLMYDMSPFHASLFLSDLGSINLPTVAHHLYNFGNCPLFMTFGVKYTAYELDKTGSTVKSRRIDYSLSIDDRVIEGMTFSPALRMMKQVFEHPDTLDVPPETVVEDVE